ncbi:MAG: PAS domain S-box protein [Leptolyngbyaceae cyanobacterium SL_7_1]|nr:PAS domain S-box protein [Leptolyngbyaceae cyanobacterium SL_7_1]
MSRIQLLEQFNDLLRALISSSSGAFQPGLASPDPVSLLELNPQDNTPLLDAESTELPSTSQFTLPADLLGRILLTMPDPLFVCARLQQLVYINPQGARSLGFKQSLTVPQTIQELDLPATLKTQLTIEIETVFATGRSITNEFSLIAPLYGLREYEYTLIPIQGTIDHIQAVLFSSKDITERKQVEAALRELELKYQALFESTNDSILILDALTGRVLNANANASRRLGYTRQELTQLSLNDLLPERNMAIVSEFQQLRLQDSHTYEQCLRHKDGTEIAVKLCNQLVEYGDRLVVQSFVRSLSDEI